MSRPIYCHGPIYCHSPIYCHNSIYGMTFKPFRALCLEGASCCRLDLYTAMTFNINSSRTKIVWGTCVLKGFNWPCFRHKANRTVNISLHLEVSSKEWGSDRENASAQAVLTPKLLGHTQDLRSVRCETCTKCCCCGSVDSFDARSVTNRKLVPSSFHRASVNRDVSTSLQGEQLDGLIDRWRRRLLPSMLTYPTSTTITFSVLDSFFFFFFFLQKTPLRFG